MLSYHRQRPSFTPTVSSSESSPPRREPTTAHEKSTRAANIEPTFPQFCAESIAIPLAVGHLYPVITDLSDLDGGRATRSFYRGHPEVVSKRSGDCYRKPTKDSRKANVMNTSSSESWTSAALQTPRLASSNDGSSTTSQYMASSNGDDVNVPAKNKNPSHLGFLNRRQRHDRSNGKSNHQPNKSHFRSHSKGASVFLREANDIMYLDEREVQTQARRFTDHYVLTRLIFQCEQSSVWECVHRSSGERYCVKIMEEANGDSIDETAQHEASMFQAAQSHTNILGLVEIIKEEPPVARENNRPTRQICKSARSKVVSLKSGKLYLVMEWMSGGNLLSFVVQNGKLDEPSVQRIAIQLLQAVDHLHTVAYLSHNDLHPANILLGRRTSSSSSSLLTWDTIKIADFGAAKPLSPPHRGNIADNGARRYLSSPRSEPTPPLSYRAPEVETSLRNRCVTPTSSLHSEGEVAADLWSIGAILYFCLLGHATDFDPDQGTSKDLPSPCHHWSRLSRHAKQFLTGLLTVDPSVRLTVDEALRHPWLAVVPNASSIPPLIPFSPPLTTNGPSPWLSSPPLVTSVTMTAPTLWTKAVQNLYSAKTTIAWTSFTNMADCWYRSRLTSKATTPPAHVMKQVDASPSTLTYRVAPARGAPKEDRVSIHLI